MKAGEEYREAPWRRTAKKILVRAAILGVLAFVVGIAFDIEILGYGLLVSIVLFAPALALAGDTRYADVSITATELVVGQDRVPLKDIDPSYGVRRDEEISEQARAALQHIGDTHLHDASPSGLAADLKGAVRKWRDDLEAEGIVLLGGAWGLGDATLRKALFIRSLTGQRHVLVIPSAAPERTAEALASAVERAKGTSQ